MSRCIAFSIVILINAAASAQNVSPAPALQTVPDRSSTEFFEKHIRPILVEHCQKCHGPKKQEAGLRLDSQTAFQKGSDSGVIVTPDLPEDSLLLKAIRYKDDIRMPPDGRLPDQQIDAITQWVKNGAVWPAENSNAHGSGRPSIAEQTKSHWAFQPVRSPDIPTPTSSAWGVTPIDAFVLAQLEQAGINPNPPADRRTLIRRATFDLHGRPPTPDEVREFGQDPSPQAWQQLIDRLLASPRYGERWARHWLDVARYSDTRGYVRLNDNPLYPAAWTYRDYVIRAFNEDLPYNRFVLEQLAADQLMAQQSEETADPRPLAAMGFLTLGQRFINSQNDIIDDRIDVVTRGLLGLTVSCARCHDHKFDPVPTKDYYSLHGVFASSIEPDVPPLILTAAERPRYAAYCQELERRTNQFHEFLTAQQQKLESSFRARAGEYLLAGEFEVVQANFLPVMFLIDATKDLNPAVTQRWARLLENTRHQHHPVLTPWHKLAHLAATVSADEFSAKSAAMMADWNSSESGDPMNAAILERLASAPLANLADVAARYGRLFADVDRRWNETQSHAPAKSLEDPNLEEVRQWLCGPESPSSVALIDVPDFLFVDTTTQNQYHEQQRLIEDWIASPGAAPHAHILLDAAVPTEPRVFLRGNASNPGDAVPRQFPEALCNGDRRPFQDGSGRLELAQAIVDPHNPLTARVLVNRVWMHHFGAGLVRTPSDFGLRGEAPTHPELLDHMADRFMADGWSIKSLHRSIMLSSVYQQQSAGSIGGEAKDPENRLLWRMNRRRLDWESLRDSLLSVSGQLDLTMGGPSVQLLTPPFSGRRSVYGFIDRQHLPGLLRTFDFVAPDSSNPQRHQTTVPQQALYLMNSPFLKERAIAVAAAIDSQLEKAGTRDSAVDRINALYWLLFSRPAAQEDIELGSRYLGDTEQPPSTQNSENSPYLSAWQEYAQSLLLSNEFMFVD